MYSVLIGAVVLVACLAILGASGLARLDRPHPFRVGSAHADRSTLEALRLAGADLTAETTVSFRLRFPSREQADRAAAEIRSGAFAPAVAPTPDRGAWPCVVTARLVPTESTIREASIRCQAVAVTNGGRYAGWDAVAVPSAVADPPRQWSGPDSPIPVAPPPINAFVAWIVAVRGYVHGPRSLLRTHRMPPADAPERLTPIDPATVPIELLTYLDRTERSLAEIGFGDAVRVRSNVTGAVTVYAALLEHTDGLTLATVAATRAAIGRTTATVVYRSERLDGTAVITSNTRVARRIPRRPGHAVVTCPAIADPVALYRVHRGRLLDGRTATGPRPVSRGGDPIAYEARETAATHAFWVDAGYYRVDVDGTLRPTVRGAIGMVWRAKFPWAQWTAWRDARARAQLNRDTT